MKKTRIRLSLFSLVLALVLFGLTIRLTGRDPLVVYWSILTGSFGSTKSFLNVLAYMLPLIMTGLGAAVAFQSGVFNIGGEGQVLVGGLAVKPIFPTASVVFQHCCCNLRSAAFAVLGQLINAAHIEGKRYQRIKFILVPMIAIVKLHYMRFKLHHVLP